ncbi:MAG: hypothetical protein HOA17_01795 [Candidatus Melainabacteria bacterium]|nr:hypothetical protein [Candidatus Melainabacteria bacterium]
MLDSIASSLAILRNSSYAHLHNDRVYRLESGVNKVATSLVKLHNDLVRNPQSKRFTPDNLKSFALRLLNIIYDQVGFNKSGKIDACTYNDHTLHAQGMSKDITMRLPNLRDSDFTNNDGRSLKILSEIDPA